MRQRHKPAHSNSYEQGCVRLRFFRADSTLTHVAIPVIKLWLNSTFHFSWLTQLRLSSNPRIANLTQIRLKSYESELSQTWITTHHVLPTLVKSCRPRGGGVAVECSYIVLFFPYIATPKFKILTFSLQKKFMNQLWLNQYPVDSTLTQMTISVIRLWLNSNPLFPRPTQF